MIRLSRKSVALVGIETSPGTPATRLFAVRVANLRLLPLAGDSVDRAYLRSHLGADARLAGALRAEVGLDVDIAGSGTPNKPPAWGPLLRACGFAEAMEATPQVRYQPISEGSPTLTLHVYRDGALHRVRAARGSASLRFDANAIPRFAFRFVGFYENPTRVANPNRVDYSAFQTPRLASPAHTPVASLFGVTLAPASLEINLGVTAEIVSFLASETMEITNREITASMESRDDGLGSLDVFAKAARGDTGALVYQHGRAPGEIVRLEAPAVQILDPSYGDRNGAQTLTFGARLLPVGGDDELKIVTR